MAAATLAETNDLPTLGVAETTPSMRQPRSRCRATSLERMRLKLRELALRLSKPWTSFRRAWPELHGNSSVCARVGKAGPILTCLTSAPTPGFGSNGLCCKPLLPCQQAANALGTRL